jgi:hypothetical protein
MTMDEQTKFNATEIDAIKAYAAGESRLTRNGSPAAERAAKVLCLGLGYSEPEATDIARAIGKGQTRDDGPLKNPGEPQRVVDARFVAALIAGAPTKAEAIIAKYSA